MRLKPLDESLLTDEQKTVLREVVEGPRGLVPKPMLGWLASPELARRSQMLGAFLRYDTVLTPDLTEIAVLVTVRYWTAPYAWLSHKRHGLKAGLDPQLIADIAARRRPGFTTRKAEIVHDVAQELLARHRVPAPLYQDAVAAFGERGVAELVALVGYYSLVAMTLNTFELDPPEGETPEISHDD